MRRLLQVGIGTAVLLSGVVMMGGATSAASSPTVGSSSVHSAATATARATPVKVKASSTQNVGTYNYAGTTSTFQQLDAYTNPAAKGTVPWVLEIHGGSWAAGDRTHISMVTAQKSFSSNGFAVFNMDYRLTTDYQCTSGVCAVPGVPWSEQLQDVLTALDWIHSHAAQFGIDPNRGALYGFSAGGQLAAAAGLYGDGSLRVKAIVTASGVLQAPTVGVGGQQ